MITGCLWRRQAGAIWDTASLAMAGAATKRRNFVFLAYHYPPSQAIGARRPAHFAKYLRRFGYRVEVITTSPQKESVPGVHSVADPATPLRKRSPSGITHMVLRKFLFPFEDSVICAPNLYRAAEEIIRDRPEEWFLFSTFPPISTHLAALQLKRKYPLFWIADFRDPYAQAPSRRTALESFPHLQRISPAVDQWIENRIVRHADLMLANTDVVADLWRSRYPQAEGRIAHLWNGFDADQHVGPEPSPPRPYRLMAHTGGMYHGRNPRLILESLDRLVANGRLDPATFRLLFIGQLNYDSIPDKPVFDRLRQAGCVDATGWIESDEEVRRISSQSDFHLLVDWKEGQQVPSKIFEYVRVGRPILALTSANSPSARILGQSGVPHLVLPEDTPADAADERVAQFLQLPSDPVEPSPWFFDQFDAGRRVQTLLRWLGCDA